MTASLEAQLETLEAISGLDVKTSALQDLIRHANAMALYEAAEYLSDRLYEQLV
jgi:hypothetical protein